MTQLIKVNALNYYVGNKTPRVATQLLLANNPHAAVGFEIRKHHPEINEICRRKKYRHTMTSIGPVRSGFSSNVAMTRDSLKTWGQGTLFGCDPAKPEAIAPERAFHYTTFFIKPRPSVVLGIHFHAAISDQDADKVKRAEEASKMSFRMTKIVAMFQAMAYDVYVLGDGNQEPGSKIKNGLGPVEALKRSGLVVHQHGLELVAHSPTVKLVDQDFISKDASGSDHPGTKNTFKWVN
jgi:hypothetical protein